MGEVNFERKIVTWRVYCFDCDSATVMLELECGHISTIKPFDLT